MCTSSLQENNKKIQPMQTQNRDNKNETFMCPTNLTPTVSVDKDYDQSYDCENESPCHEHSVVLRKK